MKVNRGDVVLVDYPFTTGGARIRSVSTSAIKPGLSPPSPATYGPAVREHRYARRANRWQIGIGSLGENSAGRRTCRDAPGVPCCFLEPFRDYTHDRVSFGDVRVAGQRQIEREAQRFADRGDCQGNLSNRSDPQSSRFRARTWTHHRGLGDLMPAPPNAHTDDRKARQSSRTRSPGCGTKY